MHLFTKQIHKTPESRQTRRQQLLPENSILGTDGIPDDKLINLCSGQQNTSLPPIMQKNLKCYLQKYRHPYLYINPVKTEQLSESPLIFQYYDILGRMFINELVTYYTENAELVPILQNLNHYKGKGKYEQEEPTPGFVISITEKYHRHPRFIQFTEMVTGFKMKGTNETLQYIGYTPGKRIPAHEDVVKCSILKHFINIIVISNFVRV